MNITKSNTREVEENRGSRKSFHENANATQYQATMWKTLRMAMYDKYNNMANLCRPIYRRSYMWNVHRIKIKKFLFVVVGLCIGKVLLYRV